MIEMALKGFTTHSTSDHQGEHYKQKAENLEFISTMLQQPTTACYQKFYLSVLLLKENRSIDQSNITIT